MTKNIFRISKPEDGGDITTPGHDAEGGIATTQARETDAEKVIRLEAEIERLNAELAGLKKAKAELSTEEKLIVAKMKGAQCTREQAILIIQHQREHDAAKAAAKVK